MRDSILIQPPLKKGRNIILSPEYGSLSGNNSQMININAFPLIPGYEMKYRIKLYTGDETHSISHGFMDLSYICHSPFITIYDSNNEKDQ